MKSRKLFIKMLAAIFAFALLTPIMSKLGANTNEVQAATTASELLNIKCQVTQGTVTETSIDKYRGNYVMRFVSSIENLDYQYVGFEITYLENEQEVTKTNKIKTVFKRIESTTGSVDGEKDTYTFSPKVISTDSEYFITAKWPVSSGDLDTEYTVRAFAKPLDGEKVYGPARTVTARDGLSTEDTTTNINMLFQNTSSETINVGDTLTVNDIADAGEVLGVDGSNVSVRISGIDKASMKAATKYTFKKGDVTVGSEIYRYLYTKYTGDASSVDTSWYTVDSSQTKFTIATSADLYGLAKLTNSVVSPLTAMQTFSGKTIYLVSDIVVNDETLVTERTDANYKEWISSENNEPVDKATLYSWEPISHENTSYRFKGCFDGQMHSISGIYCSWTEERSGLFARTEGATFKDFKLVNSYFKSTNTQTSSIASRSWGSTFENIYSNAIVDVSTKWSGGLVSYSNGITMRNCWFDGAVINNMTTKPAGGTGGLIGTAHEKTTLIENCLNTGYIYHGCSSTTGYARTGGLIGDNGTESGKTSTIYLNYCLNAGVVDVSTGGSLMGVLDGTNGSSVTTTDTYAYGAPNVVGYRQNSGAFTLISGSNAPRQVGTLTKNQPINNPTEITSNLTPSNFIGETARNNMPGFEFDTTWSIIPNENPVLTSFESVVMDTSWYDEDEDTYVLYDKADLWGFSKLSKETNFAGKTIKLGNDIVVNTGVAADWATSAPKYAWTPASSKSLPFAGTFDGQMYTISGVYLNNSSEDNGLFSATGSTSVIRNLYVKDSYFSGGSDTGSIVGECEGILDSVYSNAYVNGTAQRAGGLVGLAKGNKVVLRNCWFDGNLTNAAKMTGGLLGYINANAVVTIESCLNSGEISGCSGSITQTGGLVGTTASGAMLTINRSFNSGNVLGTDSYRAGLVGCMYGGKLYCKFSYIYPNENNTNKSIGWMQDNAKFYVSYYYGGSVTYDRADYTQNGTSASLVPTTYRGSQANDKFTGDDAKSNLVSLDFTNGTWQTVEGGTPILNFSSDLENVDKRWYDPYVSEYVLYDKGDLYGFAELAKTTDFAGKTVKLGNDIVLHEGNAAKWGTNPFLNATDKWTPIGSTSKPFAGTFDGGLYTISGLFMNATAANSGLFGETTADSVIKNVRLENSYLTSTASGFGSIVGKAQGKIEKVYSNAILNSSVNNMGGIVGATSGEDTIIQYAWFEGTVTNTGTGTRATGGIIGAAYGTVYVDNCLSNGTIDGSKFSASVSKVGGIIGGVEKDANVKVIDNLSLANVKGKYAGVIIGCIDGAYVRSTTSYARGTGAVDYIVGFMQNESKFFVDCIDGTTLHENLDRSENYKNEDYWDAVANAHRSIKLMWLDKNDQSSYSGENAKSKLKGFNFDGAWKTVENDTPILNFDDSAYESVDTRWYDETTSEYVLYDEGDLYGFAELSVTKSFKGKTIKLGKDIVVNEGKAADWATNAPERSWVPIGYKYSGGDTYTSFAGTFDGQGHTISGLYFNRTNRYAGLFACVGTNGAVKNVKLTNSYFESTARDLGSIAGRGDGKFYMIHSDAIVKGTYSMGGIIGLTYGAELENCWFKGSIINTSTGSGDLNTGGIVGFAYGDTARTLTLRNCLNTANIDASAGTKTLPFVGGIIGLILPNSKLTVEIDSCLNTGTISENAAVTGGVGAIVGYCNTDPNAAVIYRTYAIESTSGNNIIRDGLFVVDSESIKGASAETNMPYLEWGKYWQCGAEGQFPELIFKTEGYGTGISATKGEQELLAELYKDRALYQGELHAHAQTLGKGDDGKTALQTWLDEQIADNKLSFAASLDHHQYSHFTDTKLGWQKSQLIYGTEAGTTITNRFDTSLTGELHYNMLFPSNVGLEAIISDFSEFTDMSKMSLENAASYLKNKETYQFGYPDFTRERFVELIEAVRANGGFFVHAHPTQTTYAPATSLADYYFAPNVGFEVLYMNTPQLEKELEGTDNKWTTEQEARYQEYGAYVTTESATHYNVWNQLLNAKKRLYATAGSDTHKDLNTYALTSVYSHKETADVDKGEVISQLREGNFVAGAVGIQMSVQTGSVQIHMGGEADFNGNRLVVNIGDFHESVVRDDHKYRVDIYDNNGLVVRKMITPSQKMNLALTTTTHSGYYRVEVYDMTLECPIAIGNPIWNQDWK